MKNRKRIVVAFMLVAVLMLGVGYAALSVDLSITGNATFDPGQSQNEFSENVYLGETALISKTGASTTENTYLRKTQHSAELSVNSLALEGNTVTYTITIYNESVHDAKVTVESLKIQAVEQTKGLDGIYTGDDWLTTKVEFEGGEDHVIIPKGTENGSDITPGSKTVTITFTLLKNPTAITVRSINITFDATTTD